MLAQALILVAMIAILGASAVAGLAGIARTESAAAAQALIAPVRDTALARYTAAVVAPTIAGNAATANGSAAPGANAALNGGVSFAPARYVLASAGSALAAVVSVTPTAPSVPACTPGANTDAGPDVEVDGQCSGFVQESRLSLALAIDVGPPTDATDVTPLAHGRITVTLRLVAQPPYAMLVGANDDPAPGDAHEGDSGGYAGALGAFGPSPAPDDTTIHVLYACTPAPGGDCSASQPPAADEPTSLPWTNGNTN